MKTKEIMFYNAIYLLAYFFISFGISIYMNKPLDTLPVLTIGLIFSGIFSVALYFIPSVKKKIALVNPDSDEYFDEDDEGGEEDDEQIHNVHFD